jgi:hypothetical protein
MITFKKNCAFLVPFVLGLYCLIQGTVLTVKTDLLLQLVGICVLSWVPGFAYYAWRGYNALVRRSDESRSRVRAGAVGFAGDITA